MLDIKRLLPNENPDLHDRATAWEVCWEAVEAPVLRYIRYNNRTSTEDDEIFADAMTLAYLEVERGNYEPREGVPFTAYVKGIARNMILEAYRRDKRAVPLLELFDRADTHDLEATVEQSEEREALQRHLQDLPPRRRQVLLLSCEGHDTAQIAHNLGIREDLVRQEKCRGIQQIKCKIS